MTVTMWCHTCELPALQCTCLTPDLESFEPSPRRALSAWWGLFGLTTLIGALAYTDWLWSTILGMVWAVGTGGAVFIAFVCYIACSEYWHRNDVGHA